MSITWKKKFKPELILEKISATRNVSSDGGVSFSGFEFHQHLPVLASMLNFPTSAEHLNKSSLIWTALARATGELNKASFEAAINKALSKELSTSIKKYVLVTSLSMKSKDMPLSVKLFDASIDFLPKGIPRNYNGRDKVIKSNKIAIPDTPIGYLPLRITVKDKSPTAAAQQAISHVDLMRGLIALYVNFSMQWSLGNSNPYQPINRVRCGSRHTIHTPNGKVATEAVWFEPNFRPADIYEVKDAERLFKTIKRDAAQIISSPYRKQLTNALIKYARALDEPDANAAFVKLWSSLESLTTPGVADYEKLVNRCSFLYTDSEYHQQVLQHLRDYRNTSIHSGVEGEDGRTNCYLLQDYFRTVIHFYKGNRKSFSSLNEANEFLDLPQEKALLTAKVKMFRKAIKFITPITL